MESSRRQTILKAKEDTVNKGTELASWDWEIPMWWIFLSFSVHVCFYRRDFKQIYQLLWFWCSVILRQFTCIFSAITFAQRKESQSAKMRLSDYHMHHSHQTKWNEMRNNNNFFHQKCCCFVVSTILALNIISNDTHVKCRSRLARRKKKSHQKLWELCLTVWLVCGVASILIIYIKLF